MQDVLDALTPPDYAFLVGVIEGPFSLTDDRRLRAGLARVEEADSPEARAGLNRLLESEIRYLGSSDLAYGFRLLTGQAPGVSFTEIIRDTAATLKVGLPRQGTDRELLDALVRGYAADRFAALSPAEQQRMLEEIGVSREEAAAFLKRSAGRFALPALVEAFGYIVVQRLIKGVIFGAIGRIIGRQLAGRLFTIIAGRFPWWLQWVGPAAWTLSIGWTVLDLQGPATRKTVPVLLYLGLCGMRAAGEGESGGEARRSGAAGASP